MKTRLALTLPCVLVAVLLLSAVPAYAEPVLDRVVPLGTLGGNFSQGFGINDSGQVTGVSRLASGNFSHAFLYSTEEGQRVNAVLALYRFLVWVR